MAQFGRIPRRGAAVPLVLALGAGAAIAQIVQGTLGASATTATTVAWNARNPTTAVAGAPVTLSVSVSPAPLGTRGTGVTFSDNGSPIVPAGARTPLRPVSGGRASVTTSGLSIGTHSITAHFGGDASFGASDVPAPWSITVGQAGSNQATMTLTSSVGNATQGGTPISFGVTMTGKPGVANPTGSVTFTDTNGATTTMMSAGRGLSNGSVSLLWPNGLPLGTNTVSAAYSGDPNYAAQTGTLTVTVSPSPNDRYIQHLYTDLIGGQDPSGESYWVSQLTRGASRYSVAFGFTQSANYAQNLVSTMYQNEMGRPVDGPGGTYWTGRLRTGLSPEAFAASLVASDEMFNSPSFGQGNVDTYIAAVYQALLGRQEDAPGAAYWHDYLMSGGQRWQLTLDFASSREWFGITVNRLYTQFHLGTPDPGGLGYWVGQLLHGMTDYQLAATLTSSDQYFGWAQSH